ncbi:hypothetical protein CYMTET_55589 [Cymbomonas tetramitiformis]|uniref:Uncharacterized protein n=1 Tax=Cymbomonas tetramitiformis TaxID=36881 RepID=A0AAE0EPL8_9CHLO|nr:hypothetical protein CYMTET_55589 [Cymbomonas tetramitiformis]
MAAMQESLSALQVYLTGVITSTLMWDKRERQFCVLIEATRAHWELMERLIRHTEGDSEHMATMGSVSGEFQLPFYYEVDQRWRYQPLKHVQKVGIADLRARLKVKYDEVLSGRQAAPLLMLSDLTCKAEKFYPVTDTGLPVLPTWRSSCCCAPALGVSLLSVTGSLQEDIFPAWDDQQSSQQWDPGWEAMVAEQDEMLPHTVLDELQPGGTTVVTEGAWLDTELNATFGGHPEFTKEHREEMRNVVKRCSYCFANKPQDIKGYHGGAAHSTFAIPFKDETKVAYQRPRKYNPGEQEIIDLHCKVQPVRGMHSGGSPAVYSDETMENGKLKVPKKIDTRLINKGFFPEASEEGVVCSEPCGGLCAGLEMLLRCGVKVKKIPAAAIHLEQLPSNLEDISLKDLVHAGALGGDRWVMVCGYPCQDLSPAGKLAGLKGKHSRLFYQAVRVLSTLQQLQPQRPPAYVSKNVSS